MERWGSRNACSTEQESRESAVRRNGGKPGLPNLTLLSELETTVSDTFLILATRFYISKCTWTSGMKYIGGKRKKANFNDKNNSLTENWTVCGDCETYKLHILFVTLRSVFLRLPVLQGGPLEGPCQWSLAWACHGLLCHLEDSERTIGTE